MSCESVNRISELSNWYPNTIFPDFESWLQSPSHCAGNGLTVTGADFPQQSWEDKTTTTGLHDQTILGLRGTLNVPGYWIPPFDPSAIQPEFNVQLAAFSGTAAHLLPLPEPIKQAEAVVMENPDGKFFCSQLGCDAVYLRAGDCRRHLKKHNGPFFHCDQPGCGMEFYRHDKLRAHLKQGHSIAVAAPRRGQRAANSAAYRVVKRGGNN